MKQEDKDLLLRDLCARLPYSVKIKTSYDKMDEPIELKSINIKNGTFSVGGEYTTISGISLNTYKCKPYLFPLSSMTEEQEYKYRKTIASTPDLYEVYDWLNKNHFDYRDLIEKGLAIDATGLNIY